MKPSIVLLLSLFSASISLGLGAAAQVEKARIIPVALRGGLANIPVALARLDPGWWKATTPTTTAAPAPGPAPPPAPATPYGAPTSIFDVAIEECTPFLNMPGTFLANVEYWKSECKSVPAGAKYVKLTMGEVTDYFKPRGLKGICDMLTSPDQHLWSSDSKNWTMPTVASVVGLGGSGDGWLSTQKNPWRSDGGLGGWNDKRDAPSFWGAKATQTGGCCHSTYSLAGKAWAQSFKMEYCGMPKALAPICTPMTTVAGSFSADKDFWALQCKSIPMTTSFVKVAMGDSVDFYRPPTGKSYCEMLTANDAHRWSKDGETWTTPTYDTSKGLGGSAENGALVSDGRKKVTFWGSDVKTDTGGCCYSTVSDTSPGFGKSFTMSYCAVPTAPPVASFVAMLHSNEEAIQSLEKTMNSLHTRLVDAEQVNVDASGNVSLAKSGVYKLAMKSQNENDELSTITMRSSTFSSGLDQADTLLAGAAKRVGVAGKSAKATRAIAKEQASTKGLQAQDDLNDKIWKLLDPSNKDSLDATEKRVRVMEKAEAKFRKQLRGEIKTVLVTKMRRSAGRLRKVIHRLGKAGNRQSAANLGEVESSEHLGADLGLDED